HRAPRLDNRRGLRARAAADRVRSASRDEEAVAAGRPGRRARELNLVYSARYRIDIGPHVFPTLKYRLVYEGVTGDGCPREVGDGSLPDGPVTGDGCPVPVGQTPVP